MPGIGLALIWWKMEYSSKRKSVNLEEGKHERSKKRLIVSN